MRLTPITFREANAFVKAHHRHHKPVVGCKFVLAVKRGELLAGVAIIGRPVARKLDNGLTAEINRVCTDGSANVCSMLYRAAWRCAKEMGYTRIITYTLPEEGGASLRAAGFKLTEGKGGGNWNVPSRPRADTELFQLKHRWEIQAGSGSL